MLRSALKSRQPAANSSKQIRKNIPKIAQQQPLEREEHSDKQTLKASWKDSSASADRHPALPICEQASEVFQNVRSEQSALPQQMAY
jgi:hypothetical protein